MDLSKKYIGKHFTLLAGLMILAHAIIPHHHHFELSHLSDQTSTCETPVQEKIPEEPDSHCHAFNMLIVEKTINSPSNKTLIKYFSFFLAGFNDNSDIPSVKNVTTIIFDKRVFLIKQLLSTTQLLRAPPEIV